MRTHLQLLRKYSNLGKACDFFDRHRNQTGGFIKNPPVQLGRDDLIDRQLLCRRSGREIAIKNTNPSSAHLAIGLPHHTSLIKLVQRSLSFSSSSEIGIKKNHEQPHA
jgi:hypothetical protein